MPVSKIIKLKKTLLPELPDLPRYLWRGRFKPQKNRALARKTMAEPFILLSYKALEFRSESTLKNKRVEYLLSEDYKTLIIKDYRV